MTKLSYMRPVAAFVLLTFCVSVGCSTVRTVGVGHLSPDEAESLVGKNVKLHTDDGVKTGHVEDVKYPYVVWTHKERSRSYSPSQPHDEVVQTRIDLRKVQKVEIVEVSIWKTTLLVVPIVFVGALLIGLQDLSNDPMFINPTPR